jgi:hypothetical protein
MKVLIAAAAVMLPISTPVFAADYKTPDCVSGRFPEPLCHPRHWYNGSTVVVEERKPDVAILPHPPYVVVNAWHTVD